LKIHYYFLAAVSILFGTFFLWPKLPMQKSTSNISQAGVRSQPAVMVPGEAPAKAVSPVADREKRILRLEERIQTLSKEITEIDEDLRRRGFPGVFLDERLSDSERSDLLGKIASVTKLQINVATLKTQKVDLQTEDSL